MPDIVIPSSCNWVEARQNCKIEKLFENLKEVVEKDVEQFNTDEQRATDWDFASRDGEFWVRSPKLGQSIAFERESGFISIKSRNRNGLDGKVSLTVRARVIEDGSCKAFLDDEITPMELWQVSRRALENHFFP